MPFSEVFLMPFFEVFIRLSLRSLYASLQGLYVLFSEVFVHLSSRSFVWVAVSPFFVLII